MPAPAVRLFCPKCNCPVSESDLTCDPSLGVMCDDCFAFIHDDSTILVRTALVIPFTDAGLSPHLDQEPPHA